MQELFCKYTHWYRAPQLCNKYFFKCIYSLTSSHTSVINPYSYSLFPYFIPDSSTKPLFQLSRLPSYFMSCFSFFFFVCVRPNKFKPSCSKSTRRRLFMGAGQLINVNPDEESDTSLPSHHYLSIIPQERGCWQASYLLHIIEAWVQWSSHVLKTVSQCFFLISGSFNLYPSLLWYSLVSRGGLIKVSHLKLSMP